MGQSIREWTKSNFWRTVFMIYTCFEPKSEAATGGVL